MSQRLRIAITKGRLLEQSMDLFDRMGLDSAPVRDPGRLLADPALRRCLEGTPRALRRREGERQLLAFPVEEGRPFPLEPLFCLARIRRVEGQLCAVYAFDREGRPLVP